ncbi:MAG: nucleotide pyrophosphohydrolase [Candidatus Dormibacteria bacterium]
MDTLPEPQSLADLQQLLDSWIKQRGRYWRPLSQYARLAEEVGELGRELNFRFGDKPRTAKDNDGAVADELGDVLFVTILLANDLGVDLQATLLATLKKYEGRSSAG